MVDMTQPSSDIIARLAGLGHKVSSVANVISDLLCQLQDEVDNSGDLIAVATLWRRDAADKDPMHQVKIGDAAAVDVLNQMLAEITGESSLIKVAGQCDDLIRQLVVS